MTTSGSQCIFFLNFLSQSVLGMNSTLLRLAVKAPMDKIRNYFKNSFEFYPSEFSQSVLFLDSDHLFKSLHAKRFMHSFRMIR